MNPTNKPNKSLNLPPERDRLTAYEAPIVGNYLNIVSGSVAYMKSLAPALPKPESNPMPQFAAKSAVANVTNIDAAARFAAPASEGVTPNYAVEQARQDRIQAELAEAGLENGSETVTGPNVAFIDDARKAVTDAYGEVA